MLNVDSADGATEHNNIGIQFYCVTNAKKQRNVVIILVILYRHVHMPYLITYI